MTVHGTYKTDWKPVIRADFRCRKCGGPVHYRYWESDCGGFEDVQYRCDDCNYTWWVEGPDS